MKIGMGQDSHKFLVEKGDKVCVIGGVKFLDVPGLDADSDGDIVYHAICNAITSVTHVPILGGRAIEMCKSGITDSSLYLLEAKKSLGTRKIVHIALTIEGKRPRMQAHINQMRENVAHLLGIDINDVGITCTSGNGMNDFGKGVGVQCLCLITLKKGIDC